AEKLNQIIPKLEPEAEDVGPLEEKRGRLGEEYRKGRQVRATGLDLRLREVRVDRERRYQVWPDTLRDVEADITGSIHRLPWAIDAASGRDGGPHRESASLRKRREVGDEAGAARLRQLPVAPRARPSIGFLQ